MEQGIRPDAAVASAAGASAGLGRRGTPHGPLRRLLRRFIHFWSYHLILKRRDIRVTRAAGFRLTVRPTVFHPRFFISSERFAEFIGTLDLSGRHVADIGTGTGILALAAARAGAEHVLATDINPNAALSANENAVANGLGVPVSKLRYRRGDTFYTLAGAVAPGATGILRQSTAAASDLLPTDPALSHFRHAAQGLHHLFL